MWENVKVVIFDVDGTLYDKNKLQRLMFLNLFIYYFLHFWRIKELQVLLAFRRVREQSSERASQSIMLDQYQWCADEMHVTVEFVEQVVMKWIYTEPLQHLKQCINPGIKELFNTLRTKGIKIAIFSDYPFAEKLQAMDLIYDLGFSGVDKDVNALKPSPKGILTIAAKLGLNPKQCLMIGDRDDRDGESARRAGSPYIIIDHNSKNSYKELAEKLLAKKIAY
jgi:HAD superfamily hydrolase (TIGR01549 family)